MPRHATYTDVHVDKPLTQLSIAHMQDASQFVAGRFFTSLPVLKASDTFTVYPQGYFNRIQDSSRAEDGIARDVGYKTKQDSYSCEEDALRIFISDKKRANTDAQFNLDAEATAVVTNAILVGREKKFADKFLTSSANWSTIVEGVAASPGAGQKLSWAQTGADPVKEVLADTVTMTRLSAGRRPNKGLISLDLYVELRERSDLIERVQYGGSNEKPAMLSINAIAQLFELDEIMIMQSVYNAAADGIEDVNGDVPVLNTFLAEGVFLMCHVAPGAGLMTATSALSFLWNQYVSMGVEAGPAIRRYRPQDGRKGEFVEAEIAMDQKVVSADLGCLYHDMLAV